MDATILNHAVAYRRRPRTSPNPFGNGRRSARRQAAIFRRGQDLAP
jgi:hypothetical protein